MSKRKIEAALRLKGIATDRLEYNHQPTPHGAMGGWDIALSEDSMIAVMEADPSFPADMLEPDIENAAEALAWVSSLPSVLPEPTP